MADEHPRPTRRGIPFDEAASALQGCVRRGIEAEAVRYAVELEQSGYSAYVWRRIMVICSEDVGLAEPTMPAQIHALFEMAEYLRKKAGGGEPHRLMLVHAVLLLARARKSRIVDTCLIWASREQEPLDVPDFCLDIHTRRGREKRRFHRHFWEEKTLLADRETGELSHAPHLPDPYRERAMALRMAGAKGPAVRADREVGSTGHPCKSPGSSEAAQLALDDEEER
jgi:hypothetical protein